MRVLAPARRGLPHWPGTSLPAGLVPATVRLRGRLVARVGPDGAVRDPGRSRVLETALALALLDRTGREPAARGRLAAYLAAHRDSPDALDRLLARAALSGPTATTGPLGVEDFVARAPDAPEATTTSASAGGKVPVGPGPQAHYSVQAQPAAGSCRYRREGGQPLPDLKCTPGAVSPAVTQANLSSTICKSGYTATIRPSSYVTGKEKKSNAISYGYTGPIGDAEYDHQLSGVAAP